MIIQIVLILGVGCISIYFMLNRRSVRIQAGMKLALAFFTVAAVCSILFPEMLDFVATLVGVGRGTDLMLYGLVVAFMFTVLNNYFEFKEKDSLIAKLTRRIALLEKDLEESRARSPDDERG